MFTKKIGLAIALAMSAAFIVGCGDKVSTAPAEKVTGNQRIQSARGELQEIANKDFPNDYYGVGQGVSNQEGMAANISGTDARGQLATEMAIDISNQAKLAGLNSINGEAIETYMRRVTEKAQAVISGIRIQKSITEVQPDGKYIVYTLVTVPKDAAAQPMLQQISNDKALMDAAASKVLMDIIDKEMDAPAAQ